MAGLIRVSLVRELVHKHGKKTGKKYLEYLNRHLVEKITADCQAQHGNAILRGDDAVALDEFRKAPQPRRGL